MKSLKQSFLMGLTGAIAVYTASSFGLPTWILFMAWVSYYLFGTKIKTAFLIFIQQILGILIAIVIEYFGNKLTENLGSFGFPIVVFIVMIGGVYIPKLKHINNTPAYFLGMIIWFGNNTKIDVNIVLLIATTLFSGYTFAWTNVILNKWIESKHQQV